MELYAKVDSSQKPIITVTFTGEDSTDENFKQYLNDVEACYDNRETLSIIFDASNASIPKISHQKKQAQWISQNWKMIKTYCAGTAYVIPNGAIRAVLKMIFSFQNQPSPYKVFPSLEASKNWINEKLEEKIKATDKE